MRCEGEFSADRSRSGILPSTRQVPFDAVDTMNQETLWRQYAALPSDAQRQVTDFIAFLAARYRVAPAARQAHATNLPDAPIIGMWADRDDLADSSAWVRSVRECEWDRRHG